MPTPEAIDAPAGVSKETLTEILSVDKDGWLKEIADIRAEHYPRFGDKLPKELAGLLDVLESNLKK